MFLCCVLPSVCGGGAGGGREQVLDVQLARAAPATAQRERRSGPSKTKRVHRHRVFRRGCRGVELSSSPQGLQVRWILYFTFSFLPVFFSLLPFPTIAIQTPLCESWAGETKAMEILTDRQRPEKTRANVDSIDK